MGVVLYNKGYQMNYFSAAVDISFDTRVEFNTFL